MPHRPRAPQRRGQAGRTTPEEPYFSRTRSAACPTKNVALGSVQQSLAGHDPGDRDLCADDQMRYGPTPALLCPRRENGWWAATLGVGTLCVRKLGNPGRTDPPHACRSRPIAYTVSTACPTSHRSRSLPCEAGSGCAFLAADRAATFKYDTPSGVRAAPSRGPAGRTRRTRSTADKIRRTGQNGIRSGVSWTGHIRLLVRRRR